MRYLLSEFMSVFYCLVGFREDLGKLSNKYGNVGEDKAPANRQNNIIQCIDLRTKKRTAQTTHKKTKVTGDKPEVDRKNIRIKLEVYETPVDRENIGIQL